MFNASDGFVLEAAGGFGNAQALAGQILGGDCLTRKGLREKADAKCLTFSKKNKGRGTKDCLEILLVV